MRVKFVSKKIPPQPSVIKQVTDGDTVKVPATIGFDVDRPNDDHAEKFMRRRMGVAFGAQRKFLFPVGKQ